MTFSFRTLCAGVLFFGFFTVTIDTGFNGSKAAKSPPTWVLRGDRKLYQLQNDRNIKTHGVGSLRLSSDKADPDQSALVNRRKGMADFRGRRIRLTGDLRTENLQRPPMMFAQLISQSGRESQSMYGWSTATIDPTKEGWETRWTENCEYFSAVLKPSGAIGDAETDYGVILKWRCPDQKSAFFYQNVSAHHYLGKPASATVQAEFAGEGEAEIHSVVLVSHSCGN